MSAPESFCEMVERVYRLHPHSPEWDNVVDFARAVAKWQAERDAQIADDEFSGGFKTHRAACRCAAKSIRREAAKL